MNRIIPFLLTAILSSAMTASCLFYWFPNVVPVNKDNLLPATQPSRQATKITPNRSSSNAIDLPTHSEAVVLQEQQQTIESLELEIEWLQSILEELDPTNTPVSNTRNLTTSQQVWFDEDALLAIGIDGQEVALLKERVESIELEKLNLRNRATREGWNRGSKLYKELLVLDKQLKDGMSPEEYDTVLYASGKNNRVAITDTLTSSAAEMADIRSGDVIISYGGEKIYDPSALHRVTAQGVVGEMVTIILQRGDELVTVYVPRGPLGTRFKPVRGKPDQP